MTPRTLPSRLRRSFRPGAVIILVLVVICATHMAVMGSVAAMVDDASIAAFRIETIRAFYATDSACAVIRPLLSSDSYRPAAGDTIPLGRAAARFIKVPAPGEEGELVVEGASGSAVRRVKVLLTR